MPLRLDPKKSRRKKSMLSRRSRKARARGRTPLFMIPKIRSARGCDSSIYKPIQFLSQDEQDTVIDNLDEVQLGPMDELVQFSQVSQVSQVSKLGPPPAGQRIRIPCHHITYADVYKIQSDLLSAEEHFKHEILEPIFEELCGSITVTPDWDKTPIDPSLFAKFYQLMSIKDVKKMIKQFLIFGYDPNSNSLLTPNREKSRLGYLMHSYLYKIVAALGTKLKMTQTALLYGDKNDGYKKDGDKKGTKRAFQAGGAAQTSSPDFIGFKNLCLVMRDILKRVNDLFKEQLRKFFTNIGDTQYCHSGGNLFYIMAMMVCVLQERKGHPYNDEDILDRIRKKFDDALELLGEKVKFYEYLEELMKNDEFRELIFRITKSLSDLDFLLLTSDETLLTEANRKCMKNVTFMVGGILLSECCVGLTEQPLATENVALNVILPERTSYTAEWGDFMQKNLAQIPHMVIDMIERIIDKTLLNGTRLSASDIKALQIYLIRIKVAIGLSDLSPELKKIFSEKLDFVIGDLGTGFYSYKQRRFKLCDYYSLYTFLHELLEILTGGSDDKSEKRNDRFLCGKIVTLIDETAELDDDKDDIKDKVEKAIRNAKKALRRAKKEAKIAKAAKDAANARDAAAKAAAKAAKAAANAREAAENPRFGIMKKTKTEQDEAEEDEADEAKEAEAEEDEADEAKEAEAEEDEAKEAEAEEAEAEEDEAEEDEAKEAEAEDEEAEDEYEDDPQEHDRHTGRCWFNLLFGLLCKELDPTTKNIAANKCDDSICKFIESEENGEPVAREVEQAAESPQSIESAESARKAAEVSVELVERPHLALPLREEIVNNPENELWRKLWCQSMSDETNMRMSLELCFKENDMQRPSEEEYQRWTTLWSRMWTDSEEGTGGGGGGGGGGEDEDEDEDGGGGGGGGGGGDYENALEYLNRMKICSKKVDMMKKDKFDRMKVVMDKVEICMRKVTWNRFNESNRAVQFNLADDIAEMIKSVEKMEKHISTSDKIKQAKLRSQTSKSAAENVGNPKPKSQTKKRGR